MIPEWAPMRWPSAWQDPSSLDLLKGSGINFLLIENHAELDAVRAAARQQGFGVAAPGSPPAGVTVVQGVWPGAMGGPQDRVAAGPTGVPWVDSNGWAVLLAAARRPESAVWVEASPKEGQPAGPAGYLVAVADSAAYGGRWIISLGGALLQSLAAGKSAALETWGKLSAATAFFNAHKEWAGYSQRALIGVISDFAGENEFLNQEILNLAARAGEPCRVMLKDRVAAASFRGLRGVIYADTGAPAPALREQILDFVKGGGLLITAPQWGKVENARPVAPEHPRYACYASGKGRIAQAREHLNDAYEAANDAVVMVSHRYDLVRLWNGGSSGFYFAESEDRRRAVVHLIFYADHGPAFSTVRVAGKYRSAAILAPGDPGRRVEMLAQKDAVEVHLPQVPVYVALQLEA